MGLQQKVMDAMKMAMKEKDQVALRSLRAVKAAILLAQTESSEKSELTAEEEIRLVQKLVKQRKDSAAIYNEQGRADLADPELAESAVLEQFLPEQLGEEEITVVVNAVIAETGASSMKDMGRVMGMANSKLAGRADGKMIASVVKARLS